MLPWRNPSEPAGGDSELSLIPRWSILLAVVVFLATQYLFHGVLPHAKHEMLPMRLIMGYSSGTAFASYVLLVGYVSRDVRRRKMSAGLWMLLVILMPGGIGAVVYFLLRQPVLSRCPNCTTELAADFHFCPQCQFQMAPACGKCFRSVQITDVFCVQCGHDLAQDHTPRASAPIVTSPAPPPLRVVLVDDEPLARQELLYLLESIGGIEVLAQGSNGIEAVDLIRTLKPDLVFLDVQMPGLDGFAVLKKLLERKTRLPQVVFATAFDQYAVRAFEVNAVDYLLKPFDRARLLQTIDKARERSTAASAAPAQALGIDAQAGAKLDALLRLVEEQAHAQAHLQAQVTAEPPRPNTSKVIVRTQSRLLLVDQREICFAAIEEGSIGVVTSAFEGQSNCRTLEELMDQLDPRTFWRAHRSFVVNIQHIREVVPWFKSSYQLRMDDAKKTEIPVSRTQTKRLRELFNL